MGAAVKIFDDFSKGEFGTLPDTQIPDGYFHAKNMRLLRDGSLCPRPGLKSLALTGMPAGTLWGLIWQGTPFKELTIVVDDDVCTAGTSPGSAVTVVDQLDSVPTAVVHGKEMTTGNTYLTNPGDKTYLLNTGVVTTTLTPITGSPGGGDIELYGERMLVSLVFGSGIPTRVRYSEAADFTNWPTENFFDVGARSSIGALITQRGHLVVMLQNDEFWVVTGVPGVNASLRRVDGANTHPWGMNADSVTILGNDEIIFLSNGTDYPSSFNGQRRFENRHLGLLEQTNGSSAAVAKAVKGFHKDDGLILYHNQFAERRNGVWSFHTVENITLAVQMGVTDSQANIYFATAGATPVIYAYHTALERPAFTSDSEASPGDNSSTPLDAFIELPEQWHEKGQQVRVKSVTVDFQKWSTGASATNHFDVEVSALNRYDREASTTNTVGTFDEAGSAATTTGVKQRRTFNIGDAGEGGGYQIAFRNIRGIAIRSVQVVFDSNPTKII